MKTGETISVDDFRKMVKSLPGHKKKSPESDLQKGCVQYMRTKHPELQYLFFHVPNGGKRSAREAGRFKAEGVVPGVADTLLLVARKGYHGLCIEFKAGKNGMSVNQMAFSIDVIQQGYKYETVKSFNEFVKIVEEYLN